MLYGIFVALNKICKLRTLSLDTLFQAVSHLLGHLLDVRVAYCVTGVEDHLPCELNVDAAIEHSWQSSESQRLHQLHLDSHSDYLNHLVHAVGLPRFFLNFGKFQTRTHLAIYFDA